MTSIAWKQLFDFERPESRRLALYAVLVAAIVSPNVGVPSPLPAVRLEQIALALLLPSLWSYCRRHPEARRITFLDWAFLAMGAVVLLSLVLAPQIVEQSNYSFRDPFELARVAEYWLMYRLAFTVVPDDGTYGWLLKIVLVAAVVSAVLSVLQYLGPPGFNPHVTSIWSDSHNYDGVVKRSRVVGAVGNPNYFGIFGGLLLLVSLAVVLLRVPQSTWLRRLTIAGAIGATACIIMSQSRTAAIAVLGAMFIGLLLVMAVRRRDAAYKATIAVFAVSLVVSLAFVEIFPPKFGSFNDRFSFAQISNDPSVTIRITKWKSLFSGFFSDSAEFCTNTALNEKPTAGHEPDKVGGPPAAADALARDAQRKKDITAESNAVLKYSCDTGRWPTDDLAATLVPKYMPALPVDPKTSTPYLAYLQKNGFMVGANLEDPTDPEGPVYALGNLPNVIVNPSLETNDHWDITAKSLDGRPTTVLSRSDSGLFGDHALNADIGATGSVYQLTVFDFPVSQQYTASAWMRSTSGSDEQVLLYLIGILADGEVVDPMITQQATIPGNGSWVPVSVTFDTPPANRLSVLQTSIRAPIGQHIQVSIDGAEVNQGPFAASFPYVTDVDPSRLKPSDLAGFSDSPFIGIGPEKDRQVGAFDNEYALMLDRYGALGTAAYLALMVAAFLVALGGLRLGDRGAFGRERVALCTGMATYMIALAAFNVAAGSYYSFQIMAVYWLLVGFMARAVWDARRVPVAESEAAPTAAAARSEAVPPTRPVTPPHGAAAGSNE